MTVTAFAAGTGGTFYTDSGVTLAAGEERGLQLYRLTLDAVELIRRVKDKLKRRIPPREIPRERAPVLGAIGESPLVGLTDRDDEFVGHREEAEHAGSLGEATVARLTGAPAGARRDTVNRLSYSVNQQWSLALEDTA